MESPHPIAEAPPNREARFKRELDLLNQYGEEVRIEHDLISHRISWFGTMQAFLFGAFAGVGNGGNRWQEELPLLLIFLGATLSLMAFLAVAAAVRVQNDALYFQGRLYKRIRREFPEHADFLAFRGRLTCHGRPTRFRLHYQALNIALGVPCVMLLAWICTLLFVWLPDRSPTGSSIIIRVFVVTILMITSACVSYAAARKRSLSRSPRESSSTS